MMNKWISYQNRSKICKFKISKTSNKNRVNNKICKCKPKRKKIIQIKLINLFGIMIVRKK